MLSNATIQPKSSEQLGYMCPRGLTGPPAVIMCRCKICVGVLE